MVRFGLIGDGLGTAADPALARRTAEALCKFDDNRVLVDLKFTAVSRGGGVPVEQSLTEIFTVREGKIARTEVYSSREEALEAAGLSE